MADDICNRCNRIPTVGERHRDRQSDKKVVRAEIHHDYYGCESGCCGHRIVGYDEDGKYIHSHFDFTHPYTENEQEQKVWGQHFVNEFFKDAAFDYENSELLDD